MHRAVTCLVVGLLVLLACGCATSTPVEKMERLTGTVTYLQRIAMPPDAVVEVKLVEVQQGANKTIVEKRITNPSAVPVSFTLVYDPRAVHPGRQYVVQARILANGKPWYVTQTVNHQMSGGRIAHADVILQPAR